MCCVLCTWFFEGQFLNPDIETKALLHSECLVVCQNLTADPCIGLLLPATRPLLELIGTSIQLGRRGKVEALK
jgi:hypothetical protein